MLSKHIPLSAPSRLDVALQRVDVALGGLQRYFFHSDSDKWGATGFWKSCGQNGGVGGAPTNFTCQCEAAAPFCTNCYRWWMATITQSLVALNTAMAPRGGHSSFNLTSRLVKSMYRRAPYTARAHPASKAPGQRKH